MYGVEAIRHRFCRIAQLDADLLRLLLVTSCRDCRLGPGCQLPGRLIRRANFAAPECGVKRTT